ncbi:hypothetical protein BD413DRAFT_602409 [Trametes elegans]|nr:hypothetical protein BD413DRAFT_602409 [Trametes elegans]
MSLNWVTLSPARQPTPLQDEITVSTLDGVELTLQIPDAPPRGTSSSGGSGGAKKLRETGRLYLTEQRLIFVAALPSKGAPSFESLSVPLTSLVSTRFEQPLLGANHLIFDLKATPGGGLVDGTRAEVRVKDKGLFHFASSLDKTRERAIYMKRQSAEEEEGLRSTPGPSGPSTPFAPGDVPAENPPGYDD